MRTPTDSAPIPLMLDTPANVQTTANALGSALCAALGTGWTHMPPPAYSRWLSMSLIHPEGVRLNLHTVNGTPKNKPRLSIMAANPQPWPDQARLPDDRPHITVDATRSPAAIAGEIARRLFPESTEWTAKANANANEARAYARCGADTRAMLAEFNVTSYRQDGDCSGTVAGSYVRAQPNGDRVRLTIDTNADQARAIFDAMIANPRTDS